MIPSLRFGSKIIVVSRDTFQKLPIKSMTRKTGEYSGGKWHIEERVRNRRQGYTKNAADCTAGGFHNGQTLTLFHLYPEEYADKTAFQKVEEALRKDVKRATSKGQTLQGLITAGWSFDSFSRELYERLTELFQTLEIPCSHLWGQKQRRHTDLFYSSHQNRWVVSVDHWNGQTLGGQPIINPADFLHDNFETVSILPDDDVQVGDQDFQL